MRFFTKTKDGGPNSTVDAYVLVEIKSLFSIMLLKFNKGTRENYHSHAFNAFSWFIKGNLREERLGRSLSHVYTRGLFPKVTKKDNVHKVHAAKTSWVFTIRGPWQISWVEYNKKENKTIVLTNGRQKVHEYSGYPRKENL